MIPESEWTKGQREFVRTQFKTDKGSVLTVTGVAGKRGTEAIFNLECSICSKDTELFPSGFTSVKGNLIKGVVPCGCSKTPKWSNEQDLILTNRLLTEKMPHLEAVDSIKEKGKDRKFILECEVCSKDSELWPHGSITSVKGSLVSGQIPCGCSKKPQWTQPQYETLINRKCLERGYEFQGFIGEWEGAYTYLQLYNPRNNHRWNTANIHSLLNSGNGCPLEGIATISDKLRTPQVEREKQIKSVLKVSYGEFIGWENEYKNSSSKFHWLCSEGHPCKVSVNDFLHSGTRCRTCFKIKQREEGEFYGYYPLRKDEMDYLYIIHFKQGGYIKVGRSFDIQRRINQLLKISNHKRDEIGIVATYTGTHGDVYHTEQMIHSELTEMGFYHNESDWTVETFNVGCQELLFHLLNRSSLIKCVDNIKEEGDNEDE